MMLRLYLVCLVFVNLSVVVGSGQWTDMTNGSTYDGTVPIVLEDKHVYRPTSATAWVGSDVTLPDKANVTIRQSAVTNFAGNTYTQLTVIAGGDLTLYGSSGNFENPSSKKGVNIVNSVQKGKRYR